MSPLWGAAVQRLAGHTLPRAVLRLLVRGLAPRHYVGAVGALVDHEGRVLVARHAYRTDFPWGLPGGFVDPGETPPRAVVREFTEELGIDVEVERLLICDRVGVVERSIAPEHLGLAYLCHARGPLAPRLSHELVEVAWLPPGRLPYALAPFQARAVESAWAAGPPSAAPEPAGRKSLETNEPGP